MIKQFDVYYDRREDKAYYADIVTEEVTVLRPIIIQSLNNSLSRNSGCMISRRSPGNMSDCKMVLTDISKLVPLNDLGEANYSEMPYIKIGVLQGERCKTLLENPAAMELARNYRLKFQEKQKKEREEEQKAFDKEVNSRGTTENASNVKTHTYDHPETGSRIIVSEIKIPNPKTNPNVQKSDTKPAKKKPERKGRKPARTDKLGPTGPTKK